MLQQSTKNLGWDKLQIREDNLPALKKQFVDSTRDTTARQRIENSIFSLRHEYIIWHYGLLEEIESIAEDLTLLIPDQPSTRREALPPIRKLIFGREDEDHEHEVQWFYSHQQMEIATNFMRIHCVDSIHLLMQHEISLRSCEMKKKIEDLYHIVNTFYTRQQLKLPKASLVVYQLYCYSRWILQMELIEDTFFSFALMAGLLQKRRAVDEERDARRVFRVCGAEEGVSFFSFSGILRYTSEYFWSLYKHQYVTFRRVRVDKLAELLSTGIELIIRKFKALIAEVTIPSTSDDKMLPKVVHGAKNALSMKYWEPIREKIWKIKRSLQLCFSDMKGATNCRRHLEWHTAPDIVVNQRMKELRRIRWKIETFSHVYDIQETTEVTCHYRLENAIASNEVNYEDLAFLHSLQYYHLQEEHKEAKYLFSAQQLAMIQEGLVHGYEVVALKLSIEKTTKEKFTTTEYYHRNLKESLNLLVFSIINYFCGKVHNTNRNGRNMHQTKLPHRPEIQCYLTFYRECQTLVSMWRKNLFQLCTDKTNTDASHMGYQSSSSHNSIIIHSQPVVRSLFISYYANLFGLNQVWSPERSDAVKQMIYTTLIQSEAASYIQGNQEYVLDGVSMALRSKRYSVSLLEDIDSLFKTSPHDIVDPDKVLIPLILIQLHVAICIRSRRKILANRKEKSHMNIFKMFDDIRFLEKQIESLGLSDNASNPVPMEEDDNIAHSLKTELMKQNNLLATYESASYRLRCEHDDISFKFTRDQSSFINIYKEWKTHSLPAQRASDLTGFELQKHKIIKGLTKLEVSLLLMSSATYDLDVLEEQIAIRTLYEHVTKIIKYMKVIVEALGSSIAVDPVSAENNKTLQYFEVCVYWLQTLIDVTILQYQEIPQFFSDAHKRLFPSTHKTHQVIEELKLVWKIKLFDTLQVIINLSKDRCMSLALKISADCNLQWSFWTEDVSNNKILEKAVEAYPADKMQVDQLIHSFVVNFQFDTVTMRINERHM